MRRLLLSTLVVVLGVVLLTLSQNQPTATKADAPEAFSVDGARAAQRALVGDGASRAVGSAGNVRARRAMEVLLRESGYDVEELGAIACGRHGACAPVVDVVARLAGSDPSARAVLLAAHYDSARASPGACDDGLGVATVVEAARAIARSKHRRPVVVLLGDGEEDGLLGAHAFAMSPAAMTVGAILNVDARGSGGPSQMFETTSDNAWLAGELAKLERPATSSLLYEVYRRMPNDTDFTELKSLGVGLNFASTRRIEHYHSPLDTLENSELGTLAHHGENVLAMARAFDRADIEHPPRGEAVWFDVFHRVIVRWPLPLTSPLAAFGLALVLLHGYRSRDELSLVGLLSLPAALVLPLIASAAASAAIPVASPWIAHPVPLVLALHFAALAALAPAARLATRSSPRGVWMGTWLGWGVLGVLLAGAAPGASYVLVVPTLVAGVSGFRTRLAIAAPAIASAVLLAPLAFGLPDGIGFGLPVVLALPAVLVATTLLPCASVVGPRAYSVFAAAAALAVGVAWAMPAASHERPARVNVVVHQDEDAARVFADPHWGGSTWGRPAPSILRAIEDGAHGEAPAFPWEKPSPFVAVRRLDAPPPEIANGIVRSPRGAPSIAILFAKHVGVTVAGVPAPLRAVNGGELLVLRAVPASGMAIAVTSDVDATLFDVTGGVPQVAAGAVIARDREAAMASQDGDVTVISRRVALVGTPR